MNFVKQFINSHFNLSSFYAEIFATLRVNLEHCPFSKCVYMRTLLFRRGYYHICCWIFSRSTKWSNFWIAQSDIFDIIAMLIRKKIHGDTAQKMKFSIKNFFSKCDQIRSFLWIWSHLLMKSLMENFISSFLVQREVFNYYASGARHL